MDSRDKSVESDKVELNKEADTTLMAILAAMFTLAAHTALLKLIEHKLTDSKMKSET